MRKIFEFIFPKQALKRWVIEDFKDKLKPNCVVGEVSLFTAERIPNGGWKVYVAVYFDDGYTNGYLIYKNGKRIGGKLHREESVIYDQSLMEEVNKIIKEK